MIRMDSKGDFRKTREFLNRVKSPEIYSELDSYGRRGVAALSSATPKLTGMAATSWRYRIIKDRRHISIEWYNIDKVNGTPIVILLQYGHATGTGGYVQGRDFINPSMKPIFDQIAENVWRKVVKP